MPAVFLRIWLCGEFRVELHGRRVEPRLSRRRSRQLLALLALNPAGLSRERLVELLWPEEPPGERECALRQLLCELRHCLGAEMVVGRSLVRLSLPAGTFVDVSAAAQAVQASWDELASRHTRRARELGSEAVALLSGEFLAGESGDWLERERLDLEDLELCAIEALAEACLAEPGYARAAERAARRLVWRAPYRERAWSLLMRALLVQDNAAEALAAFERLRALLRDELGTVPSATVRLLHRQALDQAEWPVAGDLGGVAA